MILPIQHTSTAEVGVLISRLGLRTPFLPQDNEPGCPAPDSSGGVPPRYGVYGWFRTEHPIKMDDYWGYI